MSMIREQDVIFAEVSPYPSASSLPPYPTRVSIPRYKVEHNFWASLFRTSLKVFALALIVTGLAVMQAFTVDGSYLSKGLEVGLLILLASLLILECGYVSTKLMAHQISDQVKKKTLKKYKTRFGIATCFCTLLIAILGGLFFAAYSRIKGEHENLNYGVIYTFFGILVAVGILRMMSLAASFQRTSYRIEIERNRDAALPESIPLEAALLQETKMNDPEESRPIIDSSPSDSQSEPTEEDSSPKETTGKDQAVDTDANKIEPCAGENIAPREGRDSPETELRIRLTA